MGGSFERRPQAALVEQWLAHDGARATGHRLDPAALEDARHDFLVEVVLATATGFLTRLGAIESQAAQRRYVQRAFLSFVLRRRGAMDEAGRLRAFVRELLKGEPPPELRRQKDPTDGAV
ncbi:MAG: hypothetical protein KC613_23200, partial [Myxococcales bacterium]|nr:hypothetical protein [Myxococcales bacterium]